MSSGRLKTLMLQACEIHGANYAELKGRKQFDRCVLARDWVIRQLTDQEKLGATEIARLLGMHHTSILASLRKTERKWSGPVDIQQDSGLWAI